MHTPNAQFCTDVHWNDRNYHFLIKTLFHFESHWKFSIFKESLARSTSTPKYIRLSIRHLHKRSEDNSRQMAYIIGQLPAFRLEARGDRFSNCQWVGNGTHRMILLDTLGTCARRTKLSQRTNVYGVLSPVCMYVPRIRGKSYPCFQTVTFNLNLCRLRISYMP